MLRESPSLNQRSWSVWARSYGIYCHPDESWAALPRTSPTWQVSSEIKGSLPAASATISSVREARAAMQGLGLSTSYVQQDCQHPTGTVEVQIDLAGQPEFKIKEPVSWDFLEWTPAWADLAGRADVICFGSLARRSPVSRATIQHFLKAAAIPRRWRQGHSPYWRLPLAFAPFMFFSAMMVLQFLIVLFFYPDERCYFGGYAEASLLTKYLNSGPVPVTATLKFVLPISIPMKFFCIRILCS